MPLLFQAAALLSSTLSPFTACLTQRFVSHFAQLCAGIGFVMDLFCTEAFPHAYPSSFSDTNKQPLLLNLPGSASIDPTGTLVLADVMGEVGRTIDARIMLPGNVNASSIDRAVVNGKPIDAPITVGANNSVGLTLRSDDAPPLLIEISHVAWQAVPRHCMNLNPVTSSD
jgi:hypothetical protein